MHREDNVTYNFPDVNFIKLEGLWYCLYQIGPKLGVLCMAEGWAQECHLRRGLQDGKMKDK